jgi:predicted TIM-barrel fold metal-dependent hydrolase
MMKQFGTQESRNAYSRREFIRTTAAVIGSALCGCAHVEQTANEPVIDIHQHTNYHGRTDAELIAHQRTMGVSHTVLLPAGRYFGLEVGAGGNETVVRLARQLPRQFSFFANEVPFLNEPEPEREIRKFLRRGAIGIGEQKFPVDCDSPAMQRVAAVAAEFNVPVLMHFQHDRYNTGIEGFHKMLEKYPRVNFIGHAQTFWANIDKNHRQPVLYPRTTVTPGGMTDRLLRDYPNMFGDTSAGSGLNAFTRDEAHARDFLARHQDKLMFGSDCDDKVGEGTKCQGAQILSAIHRLAPSKAVERKILHDNARKLLRLPAFAYGRATDGVAISSFPVTNSQGKATNQCTAGCCVS